MTKGTATFLYGLRKFILLKPAFFVMKKQRAQVCLYPRPLGFTSLVSAIMMNFLRFLACLDLLNSRFGEIGPSRPLVAPAAGLAFGRHSNAIGRNADASSLSKASIWRQDNISVLFV